MPDTEALIVGAGPTGLTMAIELKRLGIPVRLIDRSERAAQYSQALVVQARTLEQFERYGLAQSAVERGRKLRKASVISEGKTVVSVPFDQIPGRYPFVLFLPQSETEKLLTDHLASLGGEIERGVEFTGMATGAEGVTAQLRDNGGLTEEVRVRWLIGCDGAHSKVREALQVPFSGAKVGLHFRLGDLELEGPDKLGDELRVYLHRGDVVFIGRLTENLYRVIVALHSAQETGDEKSQLTTADFQEPMDRAGIKLKVLSSAWMTPFHVNDRQAEHTRIGNVCLAGDASHIHSPVGGQGMNTGIQDAANLAWKLSAVQHGASEAILSSYEEERGGVGKALLQRTSRALSAATASHPLVERLRDTLLSVASRMRPIQHSIMGFISETDIEYRHSSAVIDCGGEGSLRAGDRVPNLDLLRTDGKTEPLLKDLCTGRHLIVAVDGPAASFLQGEMPHADVLSLSRRELTEKTRAELAASFGNESRILIIRPDGYLGFRGGPHNGVELDQYVNRVGLKSQQAAAAP